MIDRASLSDVKVTLDGEPAIVCGYRNDFATVRQIKSGLSAEWAWPTVERIVANGGAFKS